MPGHNLRMDPLPTTQITTATPAAAPAGGTGAAAGGWDTSGNRDSAITTINGLRTCVNELKAEIAALRAYLNI